MTYTLSTMKDKILSSVPEYFLYEDVARVMSNHCKSSIMGRIHELIRDGKIKRIRKAKNHGNTKAIYQKV